MAIVTKFSKVTKDRVRRPSAVECGYCRIDIEGVPALLGARDLWVEPSRVYGHAEPELASRSSPRGRAQGVAGECLPGDLGARNRTDSVSLPSFSRRSRNDGFAWTQSRPATSVRVLGTVVHKSRDGLPTTTVPLDTRLTRP